MSVPTCVLMRQQCPDQMPLPPGSLSRLPTATSSGRLVVVTGGRKGGGWPGNSEGRGVGRRTWAARERVPLGPCKGHGFKCVWRASSGCQASLPLPGQYRNSYSLRPGPWNLTHDFGTCHGGGGQPQYLLTGQAAQDQSAPWSCHLSGQETRMMCLLMATTAHSEEVPCKWCPPARRL